VSHLETVLQFLRGGEGVEFFVLREACPPTAEIAERHTHVTAFSPS